MWIIINNTNNKVLIDDLKLQLKPKEQFDLSSLNHYDVENSSNLARLINKNILKTLKKDDIENKTSQTINEQSVDEIVKKISQKLYEAFMSNISQPELNIPTNEKNIEKKEDNFKDISIEDVQGKVIKEKEKLSASFNHIGQKQELEKNDIQTSVNKLKDLKKGNKNDKEDDLQ